MNELANAELRAALQDNKRVSVAISSGPSGQGLKVLLGAVASDRGVPPTGEVEGRRLALQKVQPRVTPLTHRELQILKLVARGFHNRQIAAKIHRSIKTVEKHRQNLHSKLSTHEVAGLTRYALSMGLMARRSPRAREFPKMAKQLTARELEVLKLVAQGSGNKWIASELQRSIKTIDHHRENIMRKLGIHEVAGLTRHALALGLL